jgi:hypothetical protein
MPFVVGLCALGLANASGCSGTDPSDDCSTYKVHAACSKKGLLCGTDSCNIAQCDDGHWCTAIAPKADCNPPQPPAGFCPADPPATGAPCSAANGTTCSYGCPGGIMYAACNDGVFCIIGMCGP